MLRIWLTCITMIVANCFSAMGVIAATSGSTQSVQNAAVYSTQPVRYRVEPVPQWVKKIDYTASNLAGPGESEQYLLVDRQVNGSATGLPKFFREVSRPLNIHGIEYLSELSIAFNAEYQELIMHQILVIRGGEVSDKTATTIPRFIQREEELNDGIQTGYTTALFNVADVRAADIVEFSYSIVGRNPIFDNRVFGYNKLSWLSAVEKVHFRLVTDNPALKVKLNGASTALVKNESKELIEYQYLAKNEGEQNTERDADNVWLDYSDFADWEEVNQWAQGLFDFPGYPDIAIDDIFPAKASQQSAFTEHASEAINTVAIDSTGPDEVDSIEAHRPEDKRLERLRRSILFVQDHIRYLGLEFGQNTHRPYPPSDVLSNRYGDCKDKSTLLTTLLRHEGIDSYPVLVATDLRDELVDYLPSPGVFDHMITLVKYQGKSYWVDGTRTYQGSSIGLMGETDYGRALVIGGPEKSLLEMYPKGPSIPKISYKESIYADDFKQAVRYEVTTDYYGKAAERQRYRYATTPHWKIQRNYLTFYAGYYSTIKVAKDFSFSDDRQNNHFTVREFYTIPQYWLKKEGEEGRLESSVNILAFDDYLKSAKTEDKKRDFFLGAPIEIEANFSLHYPIDVGLNLPEHLISEVLGPIEYTAEDWYEKNVYQYQGRLLIKEDTLDKSLVLSYIDLKKRFDDEFYFSLYVTPPAESEVITAQPSDEKRPSLFKLLGNLLR